MQIKHFFPILQWLPDYSSDHLKGDISAGLTVGIMLIPQGMAYAIIAGLPPVYGLYASMIPQVVYAFMGTSRQMSVGPVAMDSLLVAAGVSLFAVAGTEAYIALAILLAFLMGLMQLLLGVFRLGFLVNFLSRPVISGFTSAAALIIALNQMKHLFGTEIARSSQLHHLLYNTFLAVPHIHWITFGIGFAGILLIKGIKKINKTHKKSIPAALVVVVFGILIVMGLGLDAQGVKIVRDIPDGLPDFVLPSWEIENIRQMLPIAVTLTLIAFMEAISVAKALQARHKDYEIDANQELIALGMSNIAGSFFQCYPTTGGLSRSAVNDQAGAKTGVAPLISAALIGLTLLFLTPLFYYLPKAVLGSIILVAVLGLIDTHYPRVLWRTQRDEFWMLAITFVITGTVGISEGILLGVVLSIAVVVYRSTRPHVAILGRLPNTDEFRNVERFPDLDQDPHILILRYDAQLYFANAAHFKTTIQENIQKKGDQVKLLIINAESINAIDSSGVSVLRETIAELRARGIAVYMTGVIGPVRDVLFRTGLMEEIGEDCFFLDIPFALAAFTQQQARQSAAVQSFYRKSTT